MCDNCIHNLGKLVGRYFKFNFNIKGTTKKNCFNERLHVQFKLKFTYCKPNFLVTSFE